MLKAASDRLGRWLHGLFELGLVAKGVLAGAEGLSGLGLLLTSNAALHGLLDWLIRNELAQDPSDRMALWVQSAVRGFSISDQHFYALYLSAHGGIKLLLVVGLALRLSWAYPAAMLVLSGFVAYQVHEWSLTGAPMLLVLSAFDLAMIVLTGREYRLLRHPVPPI